MSSHAGLQTALHALRAGARNLLSHLPGERPPWVVVELAGHITPRAERTRFLGLPIPALLGQRHAPSLEELSATLDELASAPWLTGVIFRIEGLRTDPATAYALRRRIAALRDAGKRTVAYMTQLEGTAYYIASAAAELVAPESAEIALHGLGISVTFMRDALARAGIRFEKLAIDEYKNAFDNLVRQEMSPAHREQLETLLERFEAHTHATIGESRGLTREAVRALIDEGISSAGRARQAGLLDRLAYEDEIVGEGHRPIDEARRFLGARAPSLGKRVALVSLTGGIMTGPSRRFPVPLPPLGGSTAGSETIVGSLRTAAEDGATAAIVLFVDSGGGSALASDLIWREVRRIRDKKPVVAVMGAVAASGGYYVLTHATRVIAAPTTITGSIGVLTGKLVLEDLYARWGLNAEQIRRGRFSLLLDPARSLGEDERALLHRSNEEIYDRFVSRVADGRGLSVEKVRELARGRIWAGADALAQGLVDELGDLGTGLARARELAGLPPNAPVWDVPASEELVLPGGDPDALAAAVAPIVRETSWLVLPASLRLS